MDIKDLGQFALLFMIIAIIIGVSGSVLTNFSKTYETTASLLYNDSAANSGTSYSLTEWNLSYNATLPAITTPYAITYSESNSIVLSSNRSKCTEDTDYNFYNSGGVGTIEMLNASGCFIPPMNVTFYYSFTAGTTQYNATSYGNRSEEELASWLPTLAIIIIAALIIGIVVLYFKFR